MNPYFVIKAYKVLSKDEDLLSSFFFDWGASGVSEELSFSQLDEVYSVQTIENPEKELNIYFTEMPDEGLLLKAKSLYPNVDFTVAEQQNKDWMAEWKKGFKEFKITEGVNIVPSWLEPKNRAELNIFIDPGMAFGTGTHETTQIAAGLIKKLNIEGISVADIGTGTALLAIMCEKLNAVKIEATEIDDTARQVAKENISLNNCKNTVIRDDQVESFHTKFDLVVANIIDGVLINIQKDLKKITKSGGHLLLTGILEEREKHFLSEFEHKDFEVIERIQKEEWLGFLLKKKQNA